MGEYAIRKSDSTRIKIGTCEDMLYLRHEDRHKVRAEPNCVDPVKEVEALRFRLPFPDEDRVKIGEYDPPSRGLRLYKTWNTSRSGPGHEDFKDESTAQKPGMIQLRHDCGLLVNIPCYHGLKLPESSKDMQTHWNGKSWFFELFQVRGQSGGRVAPIVACRWCGEKWRYEWATIWDYIHGDIKPRLAEYVRVADPEFYATLKEYV